MSKVVFATALATVFAVEASLWVDEVEEGEFGQLSSFVGAPPSNDTRCNGVEHSCSGCNVQVTCRTVNSILHFVSNSTCSGSSPYCNPTNGTCTSDTQLAPAGCNTPKPVNTVQCPRASGYYPDFTSCTKYYICSDWEAYPMDCSAYPGTVYNQRTKTCVPSASAQCFVPTCKPDTLVSYTPDPRIYALCVDNTAATAIIGTCDEGQAYDVKTSQCVPGCLSAGRFRVDDTNYTECVDLGGNKLSSPVRKTCPGKSKFDATTQLCQD
ncbi:uncharacterized protein LOC117643558 isoform X2 [Thrips palmi]|uniref:Uncharacterized protein LOC117643558 isoform X2 n=1 Tax=Thrips palmi TaxID=161013 RepID=A0A6P8YFB8_THRPL|nr:uncharacterized protein LOC117643558 isoform X2 [Thrips palmi]